MNKVKQMPEIENGLPALPYTVVKIEGWSNETSDIVHSGTGFFFRVDTKNGPSLMIGTNRHVVYGRDKLRLHMALADRQMKRKLAPAEVIDVDLTNYHPILFHPDPNVDLAMVFAQPILNYLQRAGKTPFFLPLTKDIFPPTWLAPRLLASSNVLMVGFPNGLMDTANNLPVLRRGILSTHFFADYNGKKDFLVDIAAFGGSSGSPVFAFFDGNAPSEDGWTIGETSAYFIGVLHSGPKIDAEGVVVPEPVPTSKQVAVTKFMMHLGICAKSELLEDFGKLIDQYA